MSADPFQDFFQACQDLLSAQVEVPPEAALTVPPRREFGDLSSNVAFVLAKPLRRAPRQIAQELVAKIDPSTSPLVAKAEVQRLPLRIPPSHGRSGIAQAARNSRGPGSLAPPSTMRLTGRLFPMRHRTPSATS